MPSQYEVLTVTLLANVVESLHRLTFATLAASPEIKAQILEGHTEAIQGFADVQQEILEWIEATPLEGAPEKPG